MPGKPFSGKQKKEQLQAKRKAKREKEQEAHNGRSASSEEDDDDEERCRPDTILRHRDPHATTKSVAHAPAAPSTAHASLVYGEDKKGVRSVFKKESTSEVELRKRLSYEPLTVRNFVPGVPFGQYFDMVGVDKSKLEEQHYSHTFPLTLAIPTRVDFVDTSLDAESNTATMGGREGDTRGGPGARGSRRQGGGRGLTAEGERGVATNPLEEEEARWFGFWLHAVDRFRLPPPFSAYEINTFERNLDVWRQLWRTVEQSDVVVVVADCRYPVVHLPLSLLHYVRIQMGRGLVVCLNKCDLVPPSVVDEWKVFLTAYFSATGLTSQERNVTRDVPIVTFTSLPEAETAVAQEGLRVDKRRAGKRRNAKLYEEMKAGESRAAAEAQGSSLKSQRKRDALKDLNEELGTLGGPSTEGGRGQRDTRRHQDGEDEESKGSDDDDDDDRHRVSDSPSSDGSAAYEATVKFKGQEKVEREMARGKRQHRELAEVAKMIDELLRVCKTEAAAVLGTATASRAATRMTPALATRSSERGEDREGAAGTAGGEPFLGTTTIGIVGHPNVGKSSLLNSLRGTKVVSVSSTAGHTKHLQHIVLPEDHVVLMDCPGLAVPVLGLPRPLQAVIGTHQVAQTRDPQSGVAYLASRLPLEKIYGLRKVDDDGEPWSAFELCESYAVKKGFTVKRGRGTADVHRAAIAILQEAYEGRLVLYFRAPDVQWLRSEEFESTVKPNLLRFPLPLRTTAFAVQQRESSKTKSDR